MELIKLNEAHLLAVHCMALVAAADSKGVNITTIAEFTGSSKNHLSKVMGSLSKAGLVYSVRGKYGGFHLNKKAEDIFIIDIIEAVSGKIVREFSKTSNSKSRKTEDIFGDLFYTIEDRYYNYISTTNLASIKAKCEDAIDI